MLVDEPYALMLRRGDPAFRLAVNRVLARLYRPSRREDRKCALCNPH
jgi:hypothetical protein